MCIDMNVYKEDKESNSIAIKAETIYEDNTFGYIENLPLHSIKNFVNQSINEGLVETCHSSIQKRKNIDIESTLNLCQKENCSNDSEKPENIEQTRYVLRTRASSKKEIFMFDGITNKSTKSVEPNIVCTKCNKNFSNKAQLHFHKSNNASFHCLYCKQCFCSKKLLKEHYDKCEQKFFTSNESTIKCKTCGKYFFENSNNQELCFKCQKCSKIFTNITEFENIDLKDQCHDFEAYTCDICKQTFSSFKLLRKHINAHMKNLYQCQNCYRVFKKQGSLINHKCDSNSIEICNMCHVCEKKFSLVTRLKIHILKHQNITCKCFRCNQDGSQNSSDNHSKNNECLLNFSKCMKCGKFYQNVSNIKKHSAYYKNNLPKCNNCKEVFSNVEEYSDHVKGKFCQKITKKKQYECDLCGNKFMKLAKLKTHILNDHQGINYQCGKCGLKFTCKEDQDVHISKQDCKPEDSCICEICKKVFAKKDYLKKHQYVHTNILLKCKYCYCAFIKEKSYQKHIEKMNCSKSARKIRMSEFNYKKCRLCDIEFESEKILIDHFASLHPNQQPHQCFCCESCLPTFQDLQNHIHHHNTQKYTCNLCGKPYTSQEGFRKHRLKHKGAEFKCKFCDSEFLNESRFKFHLKTCKKNPECNYKPSQHKEIPKKKNDKPKQSRQLHWESRIIMKHLRGDPNSIQNHQESQNENTLTTTFFDDPETETNVRGWFDDYYKTEEDDIAFGLKKNKESTLKEFNSDTNKVFRTEPFVKMKNNSSNCTETDDLKQTYNYENEIESELGSSNENSITESSEEDVIDENLSIDYNPKKCRLCVIIFNHEYELLHHFIKSHPTEQAHKCPNCEVQSPLFAQLKEHMKTHGIGIGVYNCDNCSKKFKSDKKMKSHSIRCKGINPDVKKTNFHVVQEVCKKCGKKFRTKFGYKRHKPLCKREKIKKKTSEKGINGSKETYDLPDVADFQVNDEELSNLCKNIYQPVFQDRNLEDNETREKIKASKLEFAGKKFEEKNNKESKDLYIGEPPKDSFPCRLCDKKFQYERGIVMHFKSAHPGHKPLICHVCNMHLADKLKEHLKTHGIGEEFICELCGKRFNQKFLSKIHEMWHEGIEFKCKNCKQKFLNKEKMDKHIGENRCVNRQSLMRLPCDICGKSYRSKFGLSKHYITHTPKELRPVKNKMNCEYCGKWFENNNGLQRHRRIHTGERPFCCRFCPKAFAQEGNCKAHERIHTGESRPRKKKPSSTVPLPSSVIMPPSMSLPSSTIVLESNNINLFTYHTIDSNATVH